MRLGEAIRILESLGDYKNSQVILQELQEMKSYADGEDERLRQQRRQSEAVRARREEAERRLRMRWMLLGGLAVVVVWVLMKVM